MSVHISGSVWWPPPPVVLEQVSTASQPGSSRATGGGGRHTEPLMCLGRSHWTLSSGMLYKGTVHVTSAPCLVSDAGGAPAADSPTSDSPCVGRCAARSGRVRHRPRYQLAM